MVLRMTLTEFIGNEIYYRRSIYMEEPLSEDDYPDDRIVSFQPIDSEGIKRSFNYIREEGQDFFRPLNIQIENSENKDQSGNARND